jgi:hypothetical protein
MAINFRKIHESVLDDKASFYTMVAHELNNIDYVTVYSTEPQRGKYSCFDYSDEGCDSDTEEETEKDDDRFCWKDCHIQMDDDGLYWESKSGKNACLLCYCIVKAELMPNHVKLWIAPKDSGTEMGIVDFYT